MKEQEGQELSRKEFIRQFGDLEVQRIGNKCRYLNEKVEAARKAALELASLEKELEAAMEEREAYYAEWDRQAGVGMIQRDMEEAARSGQPFTLSGAGWSMSLTLASQPERDYTVLFKEIEETLHVCKEAIADMENRKE